MDKRYIDLHIHTINSDGKDTPEAILKKAQELELSVISLTDHNSVGAYYQLSNCRSQFKGKIIPGVELSTTYNGELCEILGYGIDVDAMKDFISNNYYSFYEKVTKESILILKQYNEKGIVLDKEFCYIIEHEPQKLYDPHHESCRGVFLKEIKKHPENAEFFSSKQEFEQLNGRTYLRKHYSNPESKLYVDTSSLYPAINDVVDIIHKAGGKCFIAHGLLYSDKFRVSIEKAAISHGIDGLECYHSFFTKAQSEYLCAICDKNNIHKSGGSDYHGGARTDCILGKSTEGTALEISLIENWLKGINYYV